MTESFPALEHDHAHCVDDAIERAHKAMADRGLRMTPLRLRVLNEIAGSHCAVGAYDLLDKLARKRREVVYRVEAIDAERVIFNQGARIENRAGGLERVVLNDRLQEIRRETLLTELRQRIRDVRQGPDGLLYVLTDEDDGGLLRLEPAPASTGSR